MTILKFGSFNSVKNSPDQINTFLNITDIYNILKLLSLKLCVLLISQLLDSYWGDQSLFPLKSEPLP